MLKEIFPGSLVINHADNAVSAVRNKTTDVAKEKTDPRRWEAEYILYGGGFGVCKFTNQQIDGEPWG